MIGKHSMRLGRFRNDHQSGGLFVEAVDETGADECGVAAGRIEIVTQAIKQRPVAVAVRRVDEHALGFIDEHQMVVFEDDIEIDWLRDHRGAACNVDLDLDEVVRAHSVTYVFEPAINLTVTRVHDLSDVHPAQLSKSVEQKVSEFLFVFAVGGDQFDSLMHDLILSHRQKSCAESGQRKQS
jgi:hypothetical protein